jgi:hypothetical protein
MRPTPRGGLRGASVVVVPPRARECGPSPVTLERARPRRNGPAGDLEPVLPAANSGHRATTRRSRPVASQWAASRHFPGFDIPDANLAVLASSCEPLPIGRPADPPQPTAGTRQGLHESLSHRVPEPYFTVTPRAVGRSEQSPVRRPGHAVHIIPPLIARVHLDRQRSRLRIPPGWSCRWRRRRPTCRPATSHTTDLRLDPAVCGSTGRHQICIKPLRPRSAAIQRPFGSLAAPV